MILKKIVINEKFYEFCHNETIAYKRWRFHKSLCIIFSLNRPFLSFLWTHHLIYLKNLFVFWLNIYTRLGDIRKYDVESLNKLKIL